MKIQKKKKLGEGGQVGGGGGVRLDLNEELEFFVKIQKKIGGGGGGGRVGWGSGWMCTKT